MKKLLFCLLCGVASFTDISALKVVPFVSDFDPTDDQKDDDQLYVEKKKEFTYTVTNKMNETIAFEITVFRRYVDKDGKEKLVKDDDSFLVFPSQLIIAPQASRTIKLRWIGNEDFKKNPHKEQAFRVSINQFHINLNPFQKKKKRGTAMQIGFNVQTSLYMTPGKSRCEPTITNINVLPNGIARITIKNNGNRRAPYGWIRNEVKIGNFAGPFYKLLSDADRQGSLQPGQVHEFVISNFNNVAKEETKRNATRRS